MNQKVEEWSTPRTVCLVRAHLWLPTAPQGPQNPTLALYGSLQPEMPMVPRSFMQPLVLWTLGLCPLQSSKFNSICIFA
jgi:hypothetical protein